MATNPYICWNNGDEQNLYNSLIIEALKFYGEDVYYIPREVVSSDNILNEAIESVFNDSVQIEMYLENIDSFEGDGDIFSRFGYEMRDQIKLMVSKMRFDEEIFNSATPTNKILRPQEGDLIYHALSKGLYEIRYVDNETPSFYNLSNLPVYRLTCELFEYSGEEIDTGLIDIDTFQEKFTVDGIQLTVSENYSVGDTLTITSDNSPELTATAEVLRVSAANISIGLITFDTEIFTISNGLTITDGISDGTITSVFDSLTNNDSPEEPFDKSDQTGDNSALEDFGDLILDDSRNDPTGNIT